MLPVFGGISGSKRTICKAMYYLFIAIIALTGLTVTARSVSAEHAILSPKFTLSTDLPKKRYLF